MTEPELQSLADSFLPLFDNMPSLPFHAQGNKKHKCVVAHAKYIPRPKPHVIFSPRYLRESTREHIIETVKHELIHAWLKWRKRPYGHNETFIRKAIELGLTSYHAKAHTRTYARVKAEMSK